ncbi:MAG: NAD(P)H-hydrate epimerase [Peptoniphilaceae bacterium]|nr:NAD(P)H-hydrate epimerase [Peptoniphilaceae bacterium]MDY6018192.1 NAD(P)H-hydrate epimerase [Anaerococcus sp.]
MYKDQNNFLVNRNQMQEIDNYAINTLKIPSICLVERAALAVLKNIDLKIRHSFAIVVGVGNNGADGLALARNLLAMGKYVDIYIVGNLSKKSKDFSLNLEAVKMMTDNVYQVNTIADIEFMEKNLDKVNTIVDGIFGTGLSRTIEGQFAFVIDLINRKTTYTISIDLPSGLDASSGESLGDVVDSDLVVTMQLMKEGLEKNPYFKNKTVIEDIGLPLMAIEKVLTKNKE